MRHNDPQLGIYRAKSAPSTNANNRDDLDFDGELDPQRGSPRISLLAGVFGIVTASLILSGWGTRVASVEANSFNELDDGLTLATDAGLRSDFKTEAPGAARFTTRAASPEIGTSNRNALQDLMRRQAELEVKIKSRRAARATSVAELRRELQLFMERLDASDSPDSSADGTEKSALRPILSREYCRQRIGELQSQLEATRHDDDPQIGAWIEDLAEVRSRINQFSLINQSPSVFLIDSHQSEAAKVNARPLTQWPLPILHGRELLARMRRPEASSRQTMVPDASPPFER